MFCLSSGFCFGDEVKKVGVMPFTIHAKQDMEDMSTAVSAMLSTRLEKKGEITTVRVSLIKEVIGTIQADVIGEQEGRMAGEILGADFIITGELTQIGESISIDVAVLDIKEEEKPVQRLFVTSETIGDLPERLRELAHRLNFVVMDKIPVKSIRVTGNRLIESDAVLYAIETKQGEAFSPEVLQEDLRRIYQMDYFKDIKIITEKTPDGMEITLDVEEKPVVRAIEIKGNKKVKLSDIQKEVETKIRTILDLSKVSEDVERIKKLYRGKGYYNANVSYSVNTIDQHSVSVDFSIREGDTVKVKSVTFSGNDSISSRRLRKVMETRKKGLTSFFTSAGVYRDEALENDINRLTSYYFSQGFLLATVATPEVDFREDGIHIHINVDEGDRFVVGEIDFEGDLIYEEEFLASKIKLEKEKIFSGTTLSEDLVTLKALYAEEGFAYADITPLTDINEAERMVNIRFDIDKAEKIYIETIKITGNTRTRDNVIRREMRLTEGALYNSEEIKRSKQEINNLGYFENVNINTEPGTSPDLVKLSVEVEERPTGSFSIGAGYSSYDSVIGMFQISQNNLFGKGQQLSLMAQLGSRTTYFNLSYTEPWFRDTRVSLGFDIFRIEREYWDFDRDSSGFNLRTSFPIDQYFDYTRFHVTYRYEDIKIKVWDEDMSLEIMDQQGSASTSSITNSIIKDSRDDKWNTRSGVYNYFSFELAGLGGDNKFVGLTASMSRYFPLPYETAFMIGGTIGQLFGYGGKDVPISEKYFLGGIDSLRGFKTRTVGPREQRPQRMRYFYLFGREYKYRPPGKRDKWDVVGGEKELYFNFEYFFPVLKEAGVRGSLFFDTGNAYRTSETFFTRMRYSTGFGIHWYSPFGPLKVYWGINLNPKKDEANSNFEFSMGGMF